MQYAVKNNERILPSPGARATCPLCQAVLVAKCGKKIVWHWAHKQSLNCDNWRENETEWHKSWKNYFPTECQEIVHVDEKGEKHIADVKLENGLVIEIQNSPISEDEIESRNAFYKNIIWIVNGCSRRVNDESEFVKALQNGEKLGNVPLCYLVENEKSKLIEDWSSHQKVTIFDFHVNDLDIGKELWCLIPSIRLGRSILIRIYLKELLSFTTIDIETLKNLASIFLNRFRVDVDRVLNEKVNKSKKLIKQRKLN